MIAPRATTSSPIWSCYGRGLPCGATSVASRWAFTPPFHPYRKKIAAVSFCCTVPSGGIWSAVSRLISNGLPALCSPDFPPGKKFPGDCLLRPHSVNIPIYTIISRQSNQFYMFFPPFFFIVLIYSPKNAKFFFSAFNFIIQRDIFSIIGYYLQANVVICKCNVILLSAINTQMDNKGI